MTNINIQDKTLIDWIAHLPGSDIEKHKYLESTLNIGRLCLEQCRLNPNLDLLHRPLDEFINKIECKLDTKMTINSEKDTIYYGNLQDELRLLRETINELMSIKGSSNRKGKVVENLERDVIQRNFPLFTIHDMSNIGHESDIHLDTPHGKVLIELKTYTNNVSGEQIKKFYNDIDRVGYPYALFISNTSGIVGKKKFEWELYGVRNTLCIYVSGSGINGEGLIFGLHFLECYVQLKNSNNKVYNIESHINKLVNCIENAQGQIEQVSRVRGDLKLLKDQTIKKIEDISENVYNIEFNLKIALNQVVDETNYLSKTDLVQIQINELELLIREKGDKVFHILELDAKLSRHYPHRFSYSISHKDNEILIIDKNNNNILATIRKLKTKKEHDILIPIPNSSSVSFTFNPQLEVISKNMINITIDNTDLVVQRIIDNL